jgi:recombination protein RecT
MSTDLVAAKTFTATVDAYARRLLADAVPASQVARAVAQTVAAFAASRSAARDPAPFDAALTTDAGRASLSRAIVQASLSGVYPGGAAALAYLVPQRPRSGAPWEIRYQLSHRGACLLAAEEGYSVIPVAVATGDCYRLEFGEVVEHEPGEMEPTGAENLAGVYVTIRRDGKLLARPWLSAQGVAAHMARSPAKDSGPWKTDYVAMAMKTAIHVAVARGMLPLRSSVAREAMEEEAPAPGYTVTQLGPSTAEPAPEPSPAPSAPAPTPVQGETV